MLAGKNWKDFQSCFYKKFKKFENVILRCVIGFTFYFVVLVLVVLVLVALVVVLRIDVSQIKAF
jgi:hypothetical protein